MSFGESHGTRANGARAGAARSGKRRRTLTAEQIHLLLRAGRLVLLLEPVAASVLVLGLWAQVSSQAAVAWLLAVWGGSALRAPLWRRSRRAALGSPRFLEWGRAFGLATAAAGALWASVLIFLWPDQAVGHQIYLVVGVATVAGVVMFAIASHAASAYTYLGAVVAVVLGTFLWRQIGNPYVVSVTAGLVALAYGLTVRHIGTLVAGQFRLRFDLAEVGDEAEAANRAKAEFIANMSHELRTPLNAIIGFSEMMKEQAFGDLGDRRYREYANDIHNSGNHLLDIINDILDLSKFEAGKMELSTEPVDFVQIIQSSVHLLQESAERGGVSLVSIIPDTVPIVFGDARALKQILINLLSNAIKFTRLGGEVFVEVKAMPSGEVHLIVRDTGIGIAAEDIPTAMAPFGQIDASFARRLEGTGLGLPIVKSLVEQHGGEFRLTSEPGVGTTATAVFPNVGATEPQERAVETENA